MSKFVFAFILLFGIVEAQAGILKPALVRKGNRLFVKKLEVNSIEFTEQKDACALSQMKLWLKDFRKLNNNEKNELKLIFEAITVVNVGKTLQTSITSGTNHFLRFHHCSGFGRRRSCHSEYKRIGNDVVINGSIPKTQFSVKNGEALVLGQESKNETKSKIWDVRYRYILDQIDSKFGPEFESALKKDLVRPWNEFTNKENICGDVSIKVLKGEI